MKSGQSQLVYQTHTHTHVHTRTHANTIVAGTYKHIRLTHTRTHKELNLAELNMGPVKRAAKKKKLCIPPETGPGYRGDGPGYYGT